MANYQNLKAAISAAIRTNGNQEITGQVLQDVLNSIVSVIGANYTFAGVATPGTNPGTPDQNVVYLAMEGGTYTNFNGTVLSAGISLLMWNGSWTSETVMYGDGGVFDISVYKSSGGTLATFADLAAALDGGNNIPESARKGGMSVKFVQSSDNKYVQYRLMADTFSTTVTDWQGVDDEPTAGSRNLVESGGVNNLLNNNFFVGKGQTISENFYEFFIVGRTYRLNLKETDWNKTGVTQYTIFGIDGYDANDQMMDSLRIIVSFGSIPNESYEFTIPEGCVKVRVCGRAAVGTKVMFSIQDVTEVTKVAECSFTGYYENANIDTITAKGAYIRKHGEGHVTNILMVYNNGNGSIKQFLIDATSPYIKARTYNNGTWTDWQTNFLVSKGLFASEQNLNTILEHGIYQRTFDIGSGDYANNMLLTIGSKDDGNDGIYLQALQECVADFHHLVTRCRYSDSVDANNNRIWEDWLYEKKDIGKLVGTISKAKGSANANYEVSLVAGKYYRFECYCGTSKFRIRAMVTTNTGTAQPLFDIDGSLVSNMYVNNFVHSGIHIFRVTENTNIIRIMDVQNDNPDIVEGLEINIYEANPVEVSVCKGFTQNGIELPLYELTHYTNQTFENVSLEGGRFYKLHVNGNCKVTAYYNSSAVTLYDINGKEISVVSDGVYYVSPNADVNKIDVTGVTSAVSFVLRFYNQTTFNKSDTLPFDETFPEILLNYIAPITADRMYSYINGLYLQNEELKSSNAIYDFASGSISHDSTLVIHNGYAYAVFCYDGGPNAKDNASSPTAQVLLKWVNLSNTSDNGSVVIAQKDAVYTTSSGTCTQTGGAGSPTMYNVNGVLHILYAANVDNAYIQMHTTFNTSNNTIGTYDKWTLTDGVISGTLNNTLLGQMFGTERGDNVFYQMQMNCTIGVNVEDIGGVDTNVYYGGLMYGDGNGNALILKTTDFVNWELVTKFDFGCTGAYELAVWCKNGYLYACKRQPYPKTDAGTNVGAYSTNNETLSPLAKFNLSTKKWVASVAVKNCCTRMTFFEYDNKLYFVTCGTQRKNAQFILIDDNKLANSKIVLEVEHRIFEYPSIYNYNGQLYLIGTESTAHINLYTFNLAMYSQSTINNKILNLMN